MQISSHVLAYDVSSTLRAVLENIAPHVDKIFIAYPSRPWNYISESRLYKTNPTTLAEVQEAANGFKVEIIQGDWEAEEDSRNACFNKAKEESFDWFLTQDADEFYTESSWDMIRKTLLHSIHEEYFVTTWYNFWKSAQFVAVNEYGDIKDTNAGFALRCKDNLFFESARKPNSDKRFVMDCPCYHYGYVRSDAEIKEKIVTWKHATEFNALRWYQNKWLNWSKDTQNLHPLRPWVWKRAIRFPLEQPPFAIQFDFDYSFGNKKNLGDLLGNTTYDLRSYYSHQLFRLKNINRELRL
jgi:hypothetical protein